MCSSGGVFRTGLALGSTAYRLPSWLGPATPGSKKPEKDLPMSFKNIAIRVTNLSKCYQIYDKPKDRLKQSIVPRLQRLFGKTPKKYFREFCALQNVSFEVNKGETVGIIGRNGSGKSTLLQMICGTLNPDYRQHPNKWPHRGIAGTGFRF